MSGKEGCPRSVRRSVSLSLEDEERNTYVINQCTAANVHVLAVESVL